MAMDRRRPGAEHPEEWREDLHPGSERDRNVRPQDREPPTRTAYDDKDLHDRWDDLPDVDLKRIPLLPKGTRLSQGAVYLDLTGPQPATFTARADQVTGEADRYVAKDDVDYELWNRLVTRGRETE